MAHLDLTCFWNITGYAIDPPCCVPTEFDDLSMLTVTKKQFITKNPTNSDLLLKQHLMNQNQSDAEEEVTLLRIYQSMIATKCGCKWAVHHIMSSRKTKSKSLRKNKYLTKCGRK